MPAESTAQASPGILIALDALIVQRAPQPTASDDAQVALRRIGWMGRPIILVGRSAAGRILPEDPGEREDWVRGTIGSGAYAVVAFDEPSEDRAAARDEAADRWRAIMEAQRATWLLTDRPRQVGSARQAGLKVIVIGPSDPQPRNHRPDYRARDLRDAVGHLLTVDVFSAPSPADQGASRTNGAGQGA
jgi:hypothetical protein